MVMTSSVVCRLSSVRLYYFDGVHDPQAMSQMTVKEALKYDDVVVFLKLGLPGVLGMSEWWMWEVIAFMVRVVVGPCGPPNLIHVSSLGLIRIILQLSSS